VADPAYASAYADGLGARPEGTLTRVFGSRAYFRLWCAQVVSSLGDWIGLIAVTAIAARVGGGNAGTAVGLVLSARVVPGLFLGSMMGVLADRLDRKKTMVCCDIGRGLVLLSLPFVKNVPSLIVASLLLELFTLLWSSAKEASVPNLVERAFLPNANSLSLAAAYGTFPVSSAVFAGLVRLAQTFGQTLGIHSLGPESLALWFDVLTFFASASIITRLTLPRRTAPPGEGGIDLGRAFRELKEGFHFIRTSPVVRAVMIGLACGLAGGGTVVPLGPVFSDVVLHAGASGFGVLLTAFGVGVALGILVVGLVHKRLPHRRVFVWSALAGGVLLVAASMMSTLTTASLAIAAFGVCAGSVYVLGFSILQSEVEDELRGRVFATLYASTRLCLFLALVMAPLATTVLDGLSRATIDRQVKLAGATVHVPGVRLTLWLGGLVIVSAAWVAGRALRPDGRVGSGGAGESATAAAVGAPARAAGPGGASGSSGPGYPLGSGGPAETAAGSAE
jgi:dTMP kinase